MSLNDRRDARPPLPEPDAVIQELGMVIERIRMEMGQPPLQRGIPGSRFGERNTLELEKRWWEQDQLESEPIGKFLVTYGMFLSTLHIPQLILLHQRLTKSPQVPGKPDNFFETISHASELQLDLFEVKMGDVAMSREKFRQVSEAEKSLEWTIVELFSVAITRIGRFELNTMERSLRQQYGIDSHDLAIAVIFGNLLRAYVHPVTLNSFPDLLQEENKKKGITIAESRQGIVGPVDPETLLRVGADINVAIAQIDLDMKTPSISGREFANRYHEMVAEPSRAIWRDRDREGDFIFYGTLFGEVGMFLDMVKAPELIFLHKDLTGEARLPAEVGEFLDVLKRADERRLRRFKLSKDTFSTGQTLYETLAKVSGDKPSTLWLFTRMWDIIQEALGYKNVEEFDRRLSGTRALAGRITLISILLGDAMVTYVDRSTLEALFIQKQEEKVKLNELSLD